MNWQLFFSTLQLIGGIILFISYIPQIVMLHKSKSCKNQSFKFWITLNVGMMMFEANALYLALTLGQLPYAISQSLNLLCGLIVLGQLIAYRKNK